MPRIRFSILAGIRTSLIIFVWHLLLVTSWSSILPFHIYGQFAVAHNQSVVTSNVDLVDDCRYSKWLPRCDIFRWREQICYFMTNLFKVVRPPSGRLNGPIYVVSTTTEMGPKEDALLVRFVELLSNEAVVQMLRYVLNPKVLSDKLDTLTEHNYSLMNGWKRKTYILLL